MRRTGGAAPGALQARAAQLPPPSLALRLRAAGSPRAGFLFATPVSPTGKAAAQRCDPNRGETIMGTRTDLYRTITDSIVAALENAGPWRRPWMINGRTMLPTNAITSRPYRGINAVLLLAEAHARGYSGRWATFKQWQGFGAAVRKGERATTIVVWKPLDADVAAEACDDMRDADAVEPTRTHLVCRAYHVFAAEQVEGLEIETVELPALAERIDAAERFVANTRAEIRLGGDRAFYLPSGDFVQMPPPAAFTGTDTSTATEAYYATLLHELTHWTAHPERCARDLSGRFNADAYAMEELIAELGAAFLCGTLGITDAPRADHATYIASWLTVLRSDPRAIFTAASKAQEAADFLGGFQDENGSAPRA